MRGERIVGFGQSRIRYASGREIDWPVAGFAPGADRITLYFTCDLSGHGDLLADVDLDVLEVLARRPAAEVKAASGVRPAWKQSRSSPSFGPCSHGP